MMFCSQINKDAFKPWISSQESEGPAKEKSSVAAVKEKESEAVAKKKFKDIPNEMIVLQTKNLDEE